MPTYVSTITATNQDGSDQVTITWNISDASGFAPELAPEEEPEEPA